MRDDQDFIGELRTEINQGQQRRHDYIRAKLIFVAGLLGLGSLSLGNFETRQLLFVVPIIAFAYDLYTLGEDYGIRRAGSFIRCSPAAPPQEALWEDLVRSKKDPFAFVAGPLTSLIALGVAALVLLPETHPAIYGGWLSLNLVFIAGLWSYRQRLVGRLRVWERELAERKDQPHGEEASLSTGAQEKPNQAA